MKILLANNYFTPFGGAETVFYWQYQLLKEKGHEILIFATDKPPFFEEENIHPEYFPEDVDYTNFNDWDKIKDIPRRCYNIESEKKMTAFLKKFKPEFVHFHNINGNLTPSVLKASYQAKLPVILTLHDPSLFCPTALILGDRTYCKDELCVSGNYIHCILNKCRSNNYIKSLNTVGEILFRKFHKLHSGISAFITPSQALKDLAVKSGVPEEKVFVINNFISDSYLNLPENMTRGEYFLYVGRLSHEKGVNYLIDAFSKVPSEIKLRIVGTGVEKEKLEKQAEKLNLNNIEFVGRKSGDELLKEYQNCIATILPCNWFENFPTTILESFACSKPVIGSNLGGIPETVRTDETGILVEPANIEEIAEAVKKLYYEEDYLRELSLNCKNESKKYSKEVYYEKLMDLYNFVLGGKLKR